MLWNSYSLANRPCCHTLSRTNARAKRILRVEHELCFRIYKGGTLDAGIDFAISNGNAAFENATDNAFLFPDLTFADFPVGIKAGEFGAGAGAAGGTIIGFTGTKYKILAVDRRRIGWPK